MWNKIGLPFCYYIWYGQAWQTCLSGSFSWADVCVPASTKSPELSCTERSLINSPLANIAFKSDNLVVTSTHLLTCHKVKRASFTLVMPNITSLVIPVLKSQTLGKQRFVRKSCLHQLKCVVSGSIWSFKWSLIPCDFTGRVMVASLGWSASHHCVYG